MFWIITLIIGVVLLINTTRAERVTGESNTLTRYEALAVIGFSVGALLTSVVGG